MQNTNDISDYVNKQMLLMVKALEHGFLLNYVKSSNLNPILKSRVRGKDTIRAMVRFHIHSFDYKTPSDSGLTISVMS